MNDKEGPTVKVHWRKTGLWIVLLAPLLVLILSPAPCENRAPRFDWENAIYVWQYQWSSAVEQAVTRTAKTFPLAMVIVGEVNGAGEGLSCQRVRVNWNALAGRDVCPVLRANVATVHKMNASLDPVAVFVSDILTEIVNNARSARVNLKGIQLDVDCPTADLITYAAFLRTLRTKLPDMPISITTLPTWLNRKGFAELVAGLDYFVLQVHYFDRPKDIEEKMILCDTALVPRWVRMASQYGVPYYVALPTYGYQVYFNARGEFAGISAEQSETNSAMTARLNGGDMREIQADPGAIAELVRQLSVVPPPWCRGIVWFRLPVEGDILNWPLPVLEQVMRGQAPQPSVTTEIRNPEASLYEVWIQNTGTYRPVDNVRVVVRWKDGTLVAHDLVGGFQGEVLTGQDEITLTGPIPECGQPVMAGWFRFKKTGSIESISVKTQEVEIVK